ncbi:MAG: tetratricopeptide repeat protein [Spirochaetales bacterium]|nr:tetratricopeptide repeat protein [Spirochaetales bacterium]MCF7939191.1 tetratricopeptide repeat protein [Spirochaetales bacterium]
MKKFLLILVSLVLLGGFAPSIFAQSDPSIGLFATPEVRFPIGDKAANYKTGIGGRIVGLWGLPSLSWLSPTVDTSFAFIPLELGEESFFSSTNLSLVRGGLGAQATFKANERFSFYSRAHASGYYAALGGDTSGSAGGFAYGGGGGMGFLLSPRIALELAAGYTSYLGLYDDVSLSIGTTIRLTGPGNGAIPRSDFSAGAGTGPLDGYIRFASVEIDRVFPVLYKYYDDHPMGRATVINEGSRPVEDVEVRFSLKQFMDSPKVSARIDELDPGQEKEIDIYALFTEQILSVTEGAKVAAEIRADYEVPSRGGRGGSDGEVVTLDTYNRNSLRWDDDRKIAAFVTARDEEVQRFARNNASIVEDRGVKAISRELQLAMVFLEAMKAHRCTYVVDPSSAYFEMSQDGQAIDTVQFPRQTLQYRAGDCDDLSATYAALLESSGVSTAFVTVPGHIYTAFRLEMSEGEAKRTFSRSDDLIVTEDGSVWVPVETTILRKGFLAAWAEGASQWRRYEQEGKAQLLPNSESWKTYEPVAFGVSDFEVGIPLRDRVEEEFTGEFDRFVNREISGREQELLGRLEQQPGDRRLRNRLGVLYARYGKYDRAEAQFRSAVQGRDYVPGLINLGNISFLNKNYAGARDAYSRALELDSDNETALLGMARVSYAAEDYGAAEEAYSELGALDPELAERFAYLAAGSSGGGTGRASESAQIHSTIVWEEEEE